MAWLGRFDDFNYTNVFNRESERHHGTSKNVLSRNACPTASKSMQISSSVASSHLQSGYCQITDVTNDQQTASIVGVIIARETAKSVISRKGNGNERHLWAFTVCDAPSSFINVTCWGGKEFINHLASALNVGDVVDIKGAHVQGKSNNPADEKFKPWTPSSCQLSLSDNQGAIYPYSGTNASDYSSLLHVPTRPNNDFYTLEDIQANGMNLQGEHINILGVVKKIWPVREIVTKAGKKTVKADIVLCDETCPSFNLTLWDSFSQMASDWIPVETDVRISYSDFRSAMVASTDSKTIITVDPDTPEAQTLQQFVSTQTSYLPCDNPESAFGSDIKDPDIEAITDVLTVKEVKSLQSDVAYGVGQSRYGVLYAFLAHFDVDGEEKTFLRDICSKCHRSVHEASDFVCGNPDCTGGDNGAMSLDSNSDVEYSFTVSLSDHTGSLNHCWVPASVAEQIIGYKAKEFKNLAGTQKTKIKWSFLFERVKAVVKVKQASGKQNRGFVHVLALEKVSPAVLMEQGFKDI